MTLRPHRGGIRRIFELVSVVFAVVMMSCSYKAYVVSEVEMTQDLCDIFWEYFRDVLFFYFWVIYLHCAIRFRVWRKGCSFPSPVKGNLVVLFLVSILWMLVVENVLRRIMNHNVISSPFLVWLLDVVYYVPFLVPWAFWGAGRGSRSVLREESNG